LTRLAPGTAGQYLKTGGAGANPSWETLAAYDTRQFIPATSAYVDSSAVITKYQRGSAVKCPDNTDSYLYFTFYIPSNVQSISAIKLVWATSASSGNAFFDIMEMYAASAGENYNTHINSVAPEYYTTTGANKINVDTIDGAILNDVSPGDYYLLKMKRNGDHENDTLEADMYILGLLLEFT